MSEATTKIKHGNNWNLLLNPNGVYIMSSNIGRKGRILGITDKKCRAFYWYKMRGGTGVRWGFWS